MEARLLTYREAAEFLAVGKSTVYAMASQGELPCVQFGAGKTKKGVTRFRREDLEKFVNERVTRRNR